MEGLRKKEKGLMDMDNNVMMLVGQGDIKGLTGKGKNTT